MSEEDELKSDSAIVLLQRIAREVTTTRRLTSELVAFMRDAETEVPESLRRFGNYMHDVHDIKYMYEEHGSTVPKHILDEIERLDDRYRQILKAHNTDGGAIEKIRREMAGDPDNRYDHTKSLTFERSGSR